MTEPYMLLPLTPEEIAHLYLTLKEKSTMIRQLALTSSPDPVADLAFHRLNEGIKLKLEPFILLLGIERERHPVRGSKRAPTGHR